MSSRIDTIAIVAAWIEADEAFRRASLATMNALSAAKSREEINALDPLLKSIRKNGNIVPSIRHTAEYVREKIKSTGGPR